MAATATEKPNSRVGSDDYRELHYVIKGTADDAVAQSTMEVAAPATHDSLPRRAGDPLQVTPRHINADNEAECVWDGVMYYETAERQQPLPRDTGDNVTTFQIGGGTAHINHAVKHIRHFVPGQAIVNSTSGGAGGAINVVHENGKRIVKGTDVPQLGGAQLVNLTRYIASASFTSSYKATVSKLAMHTNDAGFTIVGIDSYDEGEVLFLGMDATWRGNDTDVEAIFRFAILQNQADACSSWPAAHRPAAAAAVAKKGWEYLWVAYGDAKVTVSGVEMLTQVPKLVSVEQVFIDSDLTALNP